MKLLFLGGKLYDTSKLNHPGGNFMFEEMLGREIDSYMYGGYYYEKLKY